MLECDSSHELYRTVRAFVLGGFAGRILKGSTKNVNISDLHPEQRKRVLEILGYLMHHLPLVGASDSDVYHIVVVNDTMTYRYGMPHSVPSEVKELEVILEAHAARRHVRKEHKGR